MSRGIDVKEINLVINYDVPHDAEDYVHRIGRTARVNAKGEAITLVTQKDILWLNKIEQLIEAEIPKMQPPEDIGALPKWETPPQKDRRRNFYRGKRTFNKRK
jgi:superfamily II DNA/RNA helicase